MKRIVLIGITAACASHTPEATIAPEATAEPLTVPSATAAGASAPSATSPSSHKAPPELQAMLEAHNRLRARHCAEPLVWSDTLARAANAWVDHLAARGCMLQHSQTQYGENISAGSASTQTPDQVADLWYREREHYDFATGGFSMRTGHFTQLVWRGSRRLGCAAASCGDLRVWVCNYDPPGNMLGAFRTNVLPASCR